MLTGSWLGIFVHLMDQQFNRGREPLVCLWEVIKVNTVCYLKNIGKLSILAFSLQTLPMT